MDYSINPSADHRYIVLKVTGDAMPKYVLNQIVDEVSQHEYFIEFRGIEQKSNFKFILRQKDDSQNKVKTEIMFFHYC